MFRFQVIIKNEDELHIPSCSTKSTHELVEIRHLNQEKERRKDAEKALEFYATGNSSENLFKIHPQLGAIAREHFKKYKGTK